MIFDNKSGSAGMLISSESWSSDAFIDMIAFPQICHAFAVVWVTTGQASMLAINPLIESNQVIPTEYLVPLVQVIIIIY
jgi:hypothetical protein